MSLATSLRRLHRRLLPDEPWVGWTPYLWLVYLVIYIVVSLLAPGPLAVRVVSLAAAAVFLPLYFRTYWKRGPASLPYIAAITLIGALLFPFNPMASMFFIYAGAFCGGIGPPRFGAAVLFVIVLIAMAEAALLGLKAWAWLPAGVITAVIGLANIYYAELGRKNAALRLTQEEVRRLAAVAERERIARDLHDLLGHTLSVIALKSELAGRLVRNDAERAAAEIDDVTRISRDALSQVRAAVTGYRMTGLDGEVANARAALTAAEVDFVFEREAIALPSEHETALAMVLREAVTNVLRHARARTCRARLTRQGEALSLEVADDGTGGALAERSGLSGMRERLRALGGTLEVATSGGTRLVATLPLAAGPAGAEPAAGARA